MSEFIIKSSISDLALVFSGRRGDYFEVGLRSSHLTVTRDVYVYTDGQGFVEFVRRLAGSGGPWDGAETWESLEGEFKIAATCDPLGQVVFGVTLTHAGLAEEWTVETKLLSELGKLPDLVRAAQTFFA